MRGSFDDVLRRLRIRLVDPMASAAGSFGPSTSQLDTLITSLVVLYRPRHVVGSGAVVIITSFMSMNDNKRERSGLAA